MDADVIIVGGGPASLSAALYLLRAGRSVLLLEKENFGGQISQSPRFENFPGVKAISGMEWSDSFFEQVTSLGAQFDLAEVLSVEKTAEGFAVHTNYGEKTSKAVILATGVKHRKLGIPGEEKLLGHGVSYCATCDGAFFAGKKVAVIGDANSALQYTYLLSKVCSHVDLITLFDRFFADEILVKGLDKLTNLSVYHNFSATSFEGEEELSSIVFEDTKTKEKKVFQEDGVFVAIGQVPDNDRFANLVELKKGYIVTDESMATKTPGVFAAGDCRDKKVRQVITATNDGAIAAVSASRYLDLLA